MVSKQYKKYYRQNAELMGRTNHQMGSINVDKAWGHDALVSKNLRGKAVILEEVKKVLFSAINYLRSH